MRVLIVGSMRVPEDLDKEAKAKQQKYFDDSKETFASASRAIGAALARRNHTIVSGVSSWRRLQGGVSAGVEAIAGAEGVPKEHKKLHNAIFYCPQPPAAGTSRTLAEANWWKLHDDLQNVDADVTVNWGHGKSSTDWYPKLAEVDAAVLIAGREGTRAIGYAVHSVNKPCVALTSWDGAAAELAGAILQDEYTRVVKQGGLKDEDLLKLSSEWSSTDDDANNKHAERIVAGVERLAKAFDEANIESLRTLKRALRGLTALLMLWLGVYLIGANFPFKTIAFFLMLYTSALLGTGLRILTAYQANELARVTGRDVSIEAVIALLIAFGLALLYLIGGISFTGKVVVLDVNAAAGTASETFATVSLSMSVLGLAAGYLVPLNELRLRLQNLLSEEKK